MNDMAGVGGEINASRIFLALKLENTLKLLTLVEQLTGLIVPGNEMITLSEKGMLKAGTAQQLAKCSQVVKAKNHKKSVKEIKVLLP